MGCSCNDDTRHVPVWTHVWLHTEGVEEGWGERVLVGSWELLPGSSEGPGAGAG